MQKTKTIQAREVATRMAQSHNPDWAIGEVSFFNREACIELIKPEGAKRFRGRTYYDCMVSLRKEIEADRKAQK